MLISEKQTELAVLATKDIVATMLQKPGEYGVSGKAVALKLFEEVLQTVASAITNLSQSTPKS